VLGGGERQSKRWGRLEGEGGPKTLRDKTEESNRLGMPKETRMMNSEKLNE